MLHWQHAVFLKTSKIEGSFDALTVAVWLNGNGVGHINEVALRWARLVLG